jgi:hypothetical protein
MSTLGVALHESNADNRVVGTMTGVVAIISHDRGNAVTSAELDSLAATYESLRGARPERHDVAAETWARAVILGASDGGRQTVEEQDGSWAASIGVLVHPRTLLGSRLEELEGHFGLIAYDHRDQTLTVATARRTCATRPWSSPSTFAPPRAGSEFSPSCAAATTSAR